MAGMHGFWGVSGGAPAGKISGSVLSMPVDARLALWLLRGETGASSRTIASVLSGLPKDALHEPENSFEGHCPADAADFNRCAKLLELIPEWRGRLGEVADAYPGGGWPKLVRRWDELELLWSAERERGAGFPVLNRRIGETLAAPPEEPAAHPGMQ